MGNFCSISREFESYLPVSINSFSQSLTQENDLFFVYPEFFNLNSLHIQQLIQKDLNAWQINKSQIQNLNIYFSKIIQDFNQNDSFSNPQNPILSIPSNSLTLYSEIDININNPQTNLPTYIQHETIFTNLLIFYLEIQRIYFLGNFNDPEKLGYKLIFIEISIKNSQENININTNTIKIKKKNIWNQCFKINLKGNFTIKNINCMEFIFKIMVERKGTFEILSKENSFNFSEIFDQKIRDKTVKLHKINEGVKYFGLFSFRCQLIYNKMILFNQIRKEAEIKKEITEKMMNLIKAQEKYFEFQEIKRPNYKNDNYNKNYTSFDISKIKQNLLNSLNSIDNSEPNISSIYDNQYYMN